MRYQRHFPHSLGCACPEQIVLCLYISMISVHVNMSNTVGQSAIHGGLFKKQEFSS